MSGMIMPAPCAGPLAMTLSASRSSAKLGSGWRGPIPVRQAIGRALTTKRPRRPGTGFAPRPARNALLSVALKDCLDRCHGATQHLLHVLLQRHCRSHAGIMMPIHFAVKMPITGLRLIDERRFGPLVRPLSSDYRPTDYGSPVTVLSPPLLPRRSEAKAGQRFPPFRLLITTIPPSSVFCPLPF